MKLIAASDFHGSVEAAKSLHGVIEEEKPDLALACGDISDFGDATDLAVVLEAFFGRETKGYYVLGNCDPREYLDKGVPGLEERNLHARIRLHEHTMLLGLGGSTPTPFPTWTQLQEDEILLIMEQLYKEAVKRSYESLIFVLHNPPATTKTGISSLGRHAGSRVLREYALKLHPRIIFHGHIHEGRGVDRIQDSYVVNPGPAFHGYYAIASLEDGEVQVDLREA